MRLLHFLRVSFPIPSLLHTHTSPSDSPDQQLIIILRVCFNCMDCLTMPSLTQTSIARKRKTIHSLTTLVSRKEGAVTYFRHFPGIRKDRQEKPHRISVRTTMTRERYGPSKRKGKDKGHPRTGHEGP